MDPNNDYFRDFFGTDPRLECDVRDYLRLEWMIDLDLCPHNIHEKALRIVAELMDKDCAGNIAGRIATELFPL